MIAAWYKQSDCLRPTSIMKRSIAFVHREHLESFQRRNFSFSRWRSRVRGSWKGLQRRDGSTFCETLYAYESPGWPCTTWVSIFTGTWKNEDNECCFFFSLVCLVCGDGKQDYHITTFSSVSLVILTLCLHPPQHFSSSSFNPAVTWKM